MTMEVLADWVSRYVFETQANLSTAKSPMGAFADREIDNDITAVIEALQEF